MSLPNIITLSRLVFMAAIVWLLYQQWPWAASLNCFLGIVASVSDWVDGYVARRYNMTTNLGKLMDALIDKVLVLVLYYFLVDAGLLPQWAIWLIVATAVRDLVITGMRMIAARKGVVLGADKWGKRKTIWQMTCICVLLFVPVVQRDLPLIFTYDHELATHFVEWNGLLYFLMASALTVFSGILYVIKYVPVLRGKRVVQQS
ncbi:MAG: CDP-diacylglycerol--glycerol-3-phosphate 3-phosphatidyltransferase [Verrucomicrobiota bacterium]|nr:CDP-diacylglycerol--glycerol-3-phosphate 3-phosphatidyltransferase [Verrucomicrobiota bacterium]